MTAEQKIVTVFHEECWALNQILLCRKETSELSGRFFHENISSVLSTHKENMITGITVKRTEGKPTQELNVPLLKSLVHPYLLTSVEDCRITRRGPPGP